MNNKASAIWKGGLKDGSGTLQTTSTALQSTPYDFKTRFEGAEGTNPEELIAAAHAGCFSMALSNILGQSDLTADSIETSATVTLGKDDDGPAITKVHLVVKATVPGATEETFLECAGKAKEGCPVSKLLNAEITMDAQLT
ncbi:OsmC family protein [Roseiconus lacunae]|uniref:OsmC family protein n=2 Tax=Roseiconus lacunae TaxID=2605694 RepID=A0ABT7PGA8_9BACT|nr:OsmC family protein [Roseiconus lacunae]MCD0462738.1 OsmC family protein [Roseiconus lacunae]MDM4015256.1 OsmC family protein [Roseiconus lacunae]